MIEDKIQAQAVEWFTNKFCLKHHTPRCCIFSVPNGGLRNKIEAIKLVATGMRKGVSDIIIIRLNEVLFIEFKAPVVGKWSDEQKEFKYIVNNLGFKYLLFDNIDKFKEYFN